MVAFALSAGIGCTAAGKKSTAQRFSVSGSTTTSVTIVDAEISQYITAIRSPYVGFYQAANALPTGGACLEAQRYWTSSARQSCHTDLYAVIAAAQALHDVLAKLAPPTSLKSIHDALIAATQAAHGSVAVQMAAVDRIDRQAFFDATNGIADALSGFCEPIHGLEQYVTDALPVAGGC
jgi:hypothetical protein